MKKIFNKNLLALFALFLVPLFLLSACNEVNYFNIEVYSSAGHSIVVGPNKTSNIAEGTEVELTASAGREHDFICWIKNSNQVVSIEENYKFNVNAETAGTYIGLFSESEARYMQYVALTGVSVDLGITQLNARIKMSLNQDVEQLLYSGEVSNQTVSIYNGRVFSILNEDMIVFSVEVDYYQDEILEVEKFDEILLSKIDFVDEKIEIKDKSNTITLTFEKMTKELASSNFNK